MSVDIWPPIAPADLKIAVEEARARELQWLLDELHATLKSLKHGLEDCYALLAPVDPGSTLVVSTPRNEIVKGHITRVGTRIVKGTLSLRLRTLPAQTLTLDTNHPIHLGPLTHLHSLLTDALDILTQTLAHLPDPSPPSPSARRSSRPPSPGAAAFVSAQLRLLATTITEATSVLKGPPLTTPDPGWTTMSTAPTHFLPPPAPHSNNPLLAPFASITSGGSSSSSHSNDHHSGGPPAPGSAEAALQNVSIYFGVQDSALVLWVRALEPADAPVSVSMKFALAIGTARRLEHDESERVFGYCCATLDGRPTVHSPGGGAGGGLLQQYGHGHGRGQPTSPSAAHTHNSALHGGGVRSTGGPAAGGASPSLSRRGSANGGSTGEVAEVYVREKVRVESQDPSLMSLSAKLNALNSTLSLARRNLAAVMGEEVEE